MIEIENLNKVYQNLQPIIIKSDVTPHIRMSNSPLFIQLFILAIVRLDYHPIH